jgi:small subunit ribosomal protein S15
MKMISKEKKTAVAEPFKLHKNDMGSTSVQISILTARINDLSKHLTDNKKDHASRLGLLKVVGQRRRLLNYLSRTDREQYQKILVALNIRK